MDHRSHFLIADSSFDKSVYTFPEKVRAIDHDLYTIRNKERQIFLENHPEIFSRIIHDYSEERKGFVVWRDMLEERLVCTNMFIKLTGKFFPFTISVGNMKSWGVRSTSLSRYNDLDAGYNP